MKPAKTKRTQNELSKRVGEALKRAAKLARKVAKMHDTKIIVLRDGKIVAENP